MVEEEDGFQSRKTKHQNIYKYEAYANTVEQLKILNPELVVFGSDSCAYVIDGAIMEDSPNGPIPFVPRDEVVGDSDHAPDQGFGKKAEDPVPSSTQQPPPKEDPEVASKDTTVHLD
ncbi:hypothetical protein SESBI_50357 [Sesbania bispinosa]|nr:hypothetical protein SESBI_50357 [Sesbania bispinosa]